MTQHTTHDHANDASHGRIRDGVDTVKEKAGDAYETARERASDAAQRTAATIETNPLGVLVGGLALGALVAAVLPRSAREKELLAPVGKRVKTGAVAALAAAKEAGKAELDSLGLSKGAARDQAKSLFDGVAKAATSAGKAAVEAGRENVRGA